MRRGLRYAGLLAALAAGIAAAAVLAAAGSAQDTTTETTTTVQTTTEPTTVVQTATVEETRTRILTVPATTTSGEQGSGETPTWVWVLVGALAVGLIAAVIALVARRRGSGAEQRQRQLHGAMNSWVAQGWAVESETSDSAVLRRGAERMLVTVDADGHVATRTLQ